jgi:hypothetical protein
LVDGIITSTALNLVVLPTPLPEVRHPVHRRQREELALAASAVAGD